MANLGEVWEGSEACRECGKPGALNGIGLCASCERKRIDDVMHALEADRETMSVDQLLAGLADVSDVNDIFDLLAKCQPPTDELDQAKLREHLLKVLQGKGLSAPSKTVDAWLGKAKDAEAQAQTQASMLVNLVLEREAVLFHTSDQIAYAAVGVDGHREVIALRSRAFRLWLARTFYEATAENAAKAEREWKEGDSLAALFRGLGNDSQPRVPGAQALSDATATLEGMALFDGEELPVYVRVAHVGDLIYVDLGNDAWEAVEITRSGWSVVTTPPVWFRRPSGLGELPTPEPGGTIEDLRGFLNVDEAEWPLVVAALLGLFSRGPFVVVVLLGEQGSAKSTTARVIRATIDPNTASLRHKPRSDRDLVIGANNAWVLSFDNLSSLPEWLSNAICMVATGGGYGTRALYSDDEERLFDSKRPVILNGIGTIATRSDLLDRALMIPLPLIETKKPEAEFWPAFDAALPRVLGAILDGVAASLAAFDETEVSEDVRMVDWAKWAMAGLPALGVDPEVFLAAYVSNRREADLLAIEATPVGKLIREFAEGQAEPWTGSAAELLRKLESAADEDDGVMEGPGKTRRSEGWPKQPHNLSHDLRLLAPNLRRVGVEVTFNRTGAKGRTITVVALPSLVQGKENSDTSDTSDTPQADGDAGDGSDAVLHTLGQLPAVAQPGSNGHGPAVPSPAELLTLARTMAWPGIQLADRSVAGEFTWSDFVGRAAPEELAAAFVALENLETIWSGEGA